MSIKELKKVFVNASEDVLFTVNLGGWKKKKVFRFSPPLKKYNDGCVFELGIFGGQMNVKSITNSGMMLYTFDMLGQKQTGKIKFEDIELGNTLDNE